MPRPDGAPARRWSLSLAASVAAHLMLALLIAWQQTHKPLPRHKPPQIMDVVLLNPEQAKKTPPPKDARALANRSARGASRNARDRLTRAARAPVIGQARRRPRPAPPAAPRTPPPAPKPTPRNRTRTLARRGPMLEPEKPKPHKPRPRRKPQPRQIPLSNLMPSSMALAELSRDFERERRLKQMLSREADIPINTREAKYAPYAHMLVRALEEQWRPGQANWRSHPPEERRALLRLTINRDGSLGGVEILRPSPIRQLNESAIAAIHAAAPFRPLPHSWGLERVSFYLTFEVLEDRFVFRPM